MNTKEIEKEVLSQYDNGHYNPLGADGGVMKYVSVIVDGKITHASITLDSEIAKIKRVWALSIEGKEIFDLTSQYYKLRK